MFLKYELFSINIHQGNQGIVYFTYGIILSLKTELT